MASPVGPLTRAYLIRCGYSEARIDSWSGDTRLLHDIGLMGDSAWDELTLMHREFGVDMTGFEADKYFPPELSWARLAASFLGGTELGKRVKEKYPAITLDMLEQVLAMKRWEYPERPRGMG